MSEKKKFRFFTPREREDAVAESSIPTLGYFFKLLWRKLGKLLSVNLMSVVRFLPLVAILFIYLFGRQTTTAESPVFTPLLGAQLLGGDPVSATLLGLFGEQQDAAFPTTGATVVMLILFAFTAITWGWQTVGSTYNLRSLVRGDSCFLWSDYFYAIKKNFRQGLIVGLIDVVAIGVLLFDWYYFNTLAGLNFAFSIMYFVTLALIIIYASMRFYIYPMMITFDLPIKKLIKNAFIFSMLGIKRNIMAIFGIVLIAGLNIALVLPSLSIGFTLPLILPFFYLPGFAGFASIYAAYPNIRRYMIDGKTELSTYAEDEEEEEGAEAEETDATPPPPAVD
ncbi:MAG: hypothetical protein E7624_00235 [Ruminococcaceae bacterium]|nr:hypothetical protein [Oscillospiraceae bacterium]